MIVSFFYVLDNSVQCLNWEFGFQLIHCFRSFEILWVELLIESLAWKASRLKLYEVFVMSFYIAKVVRVCVAHISLKDMFVMKTMWNIDLHQSPRPLCSFSCLTVLAFSLIFRSSHQFRECRSLPYRFAWTCDCVIGSRKISTVLIDVLTFLSSVTVV